MSALYANEDNVVYVDSSNPPFMYLDKSKQAAGFYPELIQQIFKKLDKKVSVSPLPWKRLLQYSSQGKGAVAGIYKNKKRLLIYDYSDALFTETICIYVRKNKPFSFQSLKDLSGRKIAVIRGWSYGDEFDAFKQKKLMILFENSSDENNFKMLASKRVDAVIALKSSASTTLKKLKMNTVQRLKKPITLNPTYLVFAKSVNKKAFILQFNKALIANKKTDAWKKLLTKWQLN